MKRFVWRLQRILDITAKQEQAKKIELVQLTEKLAETRGELLMLQRIIQDIISSIAENMPRKRLSEQEFFLRYSATSDEQIKNLKDQVSGLESQQRKKIAELLKAKRFREGLERLRDEARKQFMEEQEKLEQKELDERATVSFAQRGSHIVQ